MKCQKSLAMAKQGSRQRPTGQPESFGLREAFRVVHRSLAEIWSNLVSSCHAVNAARTSVHYNI